MDPETWRDNYDRPAWVRRRRDELEALTGLDIPRNLAELDDWLDRYKGIVTRKLRDLTEEQPDDESGGDE